MIRFKDWIKIENLSGPGGGPETSPENQELLAKNIASRGAGAFPESKDKPPKAARTATKNYVVNSKLNIQAL